MQVSLATVLAEEPLRIVHFLVAAVWIGANVGLLYASFAMRRRGLSPETRGEIVKGLGFLELVVGICVVLIIPLAFGFAYGSGLGLRDLGSGAANALFWGVLALTGAWIWALWRDNRELGAGIVGTRFQQIFHPINWAVRVVFAGFFLISGIVSLVGDGPWSADHIAWKAILLGIVLALERLTNYLFRDFGAVFVDLIVNGETPERFERFNRLILTAYPPVLTLYGAVIAASIIGITQL